MPVPIRDFRRTRLGCRIVLLSAFLLTTGGCTTAGFYAQAIAGQWEIWRKQVPIEEALGDPTLAAATRAKLEYVLALRTFAVRELALPDNGSYREYVDLGRDYVVWNTFAAPEFSLTPYESCFPFAGCLSYRGYFSRADADKFAAARRAEGLDVFVGGVAAYSTLGWFDDPVLSTIIGWPEARIAEILFHELAHQVLYVKGDTTFNESFAEAVASAGLARWSASGADAGAHDTITILTTREDELTALILEHRTALAALYAGPLPATEKRQAKAEIFATLARDYATLRASWDGDRRFDAFMAQTWNNARMSSIATYRQLVPGFRALLSALHDDFSRFYASSAELAEIPLPDRHACLQALAQERLPQHCPATVITAITAHSE